MLGLGISGAMGGGGGGLSVGYTLSAFSGDDETEITATATGDAGTDYTWILNEGLTNSEGISYEKSYLGNPATIKFNKYGDNSLKLIVLVSGTGKSGEYEEAAAYDGSIDWADRHITRCGDLNATTQAALQNFMSEMKVDAEDLTYTKCFHFSGESDPWSNEKCMQEVKRKILTEKIIISKSIYS